MAPCRALLTTLTSWSTELLTDTQTTQQATRTFTEAIQAASTAKKTDENLALWLLACVQHALSGHERQRQPARAALWLDLLAATSETFEPVAQAMAAPALELLVLLLDQREAMAGSMAGLHAMDRLATLVTPVTFAASPTSVFSALVGLLDSNVVAWVRLGARQLSDALFGVLGGEDQRRVFDSLVGLTGAAARREEVMEDVVRFFLFVGSLSLLLFFPCFYLIERNSRINFCR